jgi:hypothetical protein
MANVLGKEVSDGSHNVIYKEAGAGEVPNLIVEQVTDGENVRYKIAGAGEFPNAIVSFSGSAPWTPGDIDTSGWYDADDASTITESGGLVSQWDDKSGNNNHVTQGSASNQPTTGTRTINSLNALDFDGDQISTNNSVMSGNPDITIATVIIYDRNVGAAADRAVQLGNGSGATVAITGGAAGYSFRFDNGSAVYGATSLATPIIQVGVRAAGSDYQSSQMFINGTESSRTSGSGDTNTPNIGAGLSLGSGLNGNNKIDGVIGETIIVEDSTLATRQKIEGYLAWKWGLVANLDPGHPYKSVAP